MNQQVNKNKRKISGNQIGLFGAIATTAGILIGLTFIKIDQIRHQVEISLIITFIAYVSYIAIEPFLPDHQDNKKIKKKNRFIKSLIIGLFVIFLYYSLTILYKYCVTSLKLPSSIPYYVFLIGLISSFLIGLLTYRILLCLSKRYFFVLFKYSTVEDFLDLLYGHRRYKVVRSFGSYCLNGAHMLSRAAKKVKNNSSHAIRAVQLPSQEIKEQGDREKFNDYITKTYEMIFTRQWEYNRLVYFSLDTDKEYFQLKKAFKMAFTFIRTLLLEYYFSQCDRISFCEINKKYSITTPKDYKYGVAHELSSKRKVDIKTMTENLKRTTISFTSKTSEFIELAMKLDLHLPPGDEFSVAFTDNGHFQGFIRVSNQNIMKGKTGKDIKKYFEGVFDKHFNEGTEIPMREVLEKLNIRKIMNENSHSKDLFDCWKNDKIDEHLFNYLSDKLFEQVSVSASLISKIKGDCENNFIA